MRETIGKRIEQIREENGYTQQQVADFLELSQGYISKIEKGEREIGLFELEKLAMLFGCDLECFLDNHVECNPIKLAYRATGVGMDDLRVIAQIKKIALNIRQMEKILSYEDGQNAD